MRKEQEELDNLDSALDNFKKRREEDYESMDDEERRIHSHQDEDSIKKQLEEIRKKTESVNKRESSYDKHFEKRYHKEASRAASDPVYRMDLRKNMDKKTDNPKKLQSMINSIALKNIEDKAAAEKRHHEEQARKQEEALKKEQVETKTPKTKKEKPSLQNIVDRNRRIQDKYGLNKKDQPTPSDKEKKDHWSDILSRV